VKDFIRYRLTGTPGTDAYDAANTGLYCPRTGTWFEPILALVGVTLEHMPPILEASTIAGYVTEEAAHETGLAAGTPVVTGSGDVNCTCIGTNVIDEKQACLYLGTAAWMRIPCPSRRGGTVRATSTTGAALKWMANLFAPGAAPVSFRQNTRTAVTDSVGAPLSSVEEDHYGEGEHPGVLVSHLRAEESAKVVTTGIDTHPLPSPGELYSILLEEAAGVPPGSRGLLFLPHLMGERGPQPDPNAKGTLFGLTMAHERADIARAVLEGCAFQLLRIVEDCGSPELHEITVVGGGVKSPLWLDIIADVLGARLLIPRVLEAGALGAAILAGVGVGTYTDACQAAAGLVNIERRHGPDPTRHALYQRIYQRFVALEKSVSPLYDDIEDEK
jgi:xylulokinase